MKKTRRPQRIYLVTVLLWLVVVMVHAWWHIYAILAGQPSSDLYANKLGFQLIAYAFVWLPRFIGVLLCLLLIEFAVFGRKTGFSDKGPRQGT